MGTGKNKVGMRPEHQQSDQDDKEPVRNGEAQKIANELSNALSQYNDETFKYRVLTTLTKFAVKHRIVPSRCILKTPTKTVLESEDILDEYQKDGLCIRVLKQPNGWQEVSSEYIREMIHFTHSSHENILRLDDIFEINYPIAMPPPKIMGTLGQYIRSTNEPHFHFIDDILQGLSYLHSLRAVHNDLNDQNVLVTNDKALIANFGSYIQLKTTPVGGRSSEERTIRNFAAFEILDADGSKPTRASNIWSFGGLCYQILSKRIPYEGLSEAQIKDCMLMGEHPERANIDDDRKWHLIKTRCWARNPDERPDCETISRIMKSWQPHSDDELAARPSTTRPNSGDPIIPLLNNAEEQLKDENLIFTEEGPQRGNPLSRMLGKLGPRRMKDTQRYLYMHARVNLRNISKVAPVAGVEDLTEKDIIIVAMGQTGAGKSTFIQTVAGELFDTREVGHQLQSATSEVRAYRFAFTDTPGTNLVLVDTPGFDDTHRSDSEILNRIAEWLKQVNGRARRISGILYLHRITDGRVTGSIMRNSEMFQKFCGKDFFPQVILVTTMWPEDTKYYDECSPRDENLRTDFWRVMIDLGSKVLPFWKTVDSAEWIINTIVDVEKLQIQEKKVGEGRKMSDATIGKPLTQESMVGSEMGPPNTRAGKLLRELLVLTEEKNKIVTTLTGELNKPADRINWGSKFIQGNIKELRQMRKKQATVMHGLSECKADLIS